MESNRFYKGYKMKFSGKIIVASVLSASIFGSAHAAIVGAEVGALIGVSINSQQHLNLDADTTFSAGAFGRIWLKPSIVRIAPFVKWESIGSLDDTRRSNNFQYGVLLGAYVSKLTPYIGVAYSHFTNTALEHTWAINYGFKFDLPGHITLGIDGSYQSPKLVGVKVDINRVGVTLGIEF